MFYCTAFCGSIFFAGSKIRTVKWRVLVTSNWIFLIIVQIISDLGNTPEKAVVNIQIKQKTSIFTSGLPLAEYFMYDIEAANKRLISGCEKNAEDMNNSYSAAPCEIGAIATLLPYSKVTFGINRQLSGSHALL